MVGCTLFVSFLLGTHLGVFVLLESKDRVCSLLVRSLIVSQWHGPRVFVLVIFPRSFCRIHSGSLDIVPVGSLLVSLYLGLRHVAVVARLKFWLGSKLLPLVVNPCRYRF